MVAAAAPVGAAPGPAGPVAAGPAVLRRTCAGATRRPGGPPGGSGRRVWGSLSPRWHVQHVTRIWPGSGSSPTSIGKVLVQRLGELEHRASGLLVILLVAREVVGVEVLLVRPGHVAVHAPDAQRLREAAHHAHDLAPIHLLGQDLEVLGCRRGEARAASGRATLRPPGRRSLRWPLWRLPGDGDDGAAQQGSGKGRSASEHAALLDQVNCWSRTVVLPTTHRHPPLRVLLVLPLVAPAAGDREAALLQQRVDVGVAAAELAVGLGAVDGVAGRQDDRLNFCATVGSHGLPASSNASQVSASITSDHR